MPPAVTHLRLVADPDKQVSAPAFPARSSRTPRHRRGAARRPLGQILLDMKAVDPGNMLKALALRDREEARLGDILLTHGWVSEADLMAALSVQWGARVLDLIAAPPDPRLLDRIGAGICLAHGFVPWHRIGGATVLATSRPEDFVHLRGVLPCDFGPVVMALAPEHDIHAALVAARETALIRRAETRVRADESCRSQDSGRARRTGIVALAAFAAFTAIAPVTAFAVLTILAVASLVAFTAVKLACCLAEFHARRCALTSVPPKPMARLPIVSVMVPLFHEDDIAPRLIRRLGRIDYPKELLDVLLVVEADDDRTLSALTDRGLPRWMRVITVPDGPIRTKPRALNYALDFCRGSIIGIWDAEDAPEPQQIQKVVRRFHEAAPDTVCLQGILDFYNSRHNWLTRCFTVEYAVWFRTLLPGLARLGFVVPLGGTTLFFRRVILEELGGWDAHNVTEDADLGLRLARHGYRTELIDTVTEEEPNSRALTWIRQRSRWQKGFAVTWASHMRDPSRLWRELGAKRFLGVQVLLVGSLSQALLMPVLLSFWLVAAGLPHPLDGTLSPATLKMLGVLFLVAEAVNIGIGLWATRGPAHRHLQKWVPTLHVYAPLATLSSYKALYEWITRPFFWDKTAHGVVAARQGAADLLPVYLLTDPLHVPSADTAPALLRPAPRTAPRLHLVGSATERNMVEDHGDFATTTSVLPPTPVPGTGASRPYLLTSPLRDTTFGSSIEFETGLERPRDM